MTNDRFFRGFLAALCQEGLQFLVTRDDTHHKKFQAVVRILEQLSEEEQDDLPAFVPSPFTGRFRELEDAILQMQRGFLGAQNPFYPGVQVDITAERAVVILEQFSASERELFRRLARAYKEKGTAPVAQG
jgi:Mn-containing catalase